MVEKPARCYLKRLLIISPYFPPTNAADMQRVRMSLLYFKQFGWEPEVVTVDEQYADLAKDPLLVQSVPVDIIIHKVKALNKALTSKIGLGSIAYRSLIFYRRKVNSLLKTGNYDLIYFSTTQFPVCILGAYWKKKFNVPYIIDMQDPWHSDYYLDKPKEQRPKKYWLSYRFNKALEPIAMKKVDGLVSVSDDYTRILKDRYPEIKNIPSTTITFGAFSPDLEIAANHADQFKPVLNPGFKNIVYIGRGGMDMHNAIKPVFEALKKGLADAPEFFDQLKFYFIGTSYAPDGQGTPTIAPLAKTYGIEENIIEITDRIGYYHTLVTLQQADALFMPGSDDPQYTASKIYPYLLTHKPMLSVFNSKSSAVTILDEYGATFNYSYDATPAIRSKIYGFLLNLVKGALGPQVYNKTAEEKYSAKNMTERQCAFFDLVLNGKS